ncbi:MAG: universal stress protein [Deltaproteobacteria bacterium]|nr:universal stress protein [Deltaproteobacteria bacterium]
MAWLPKNTVLVPVDFSDASAEALKVALDLTDSREHVHVLHVLPYLSPVEPGVLFGKITPETRLAKATEAVIKRVTDAGYGGVVVAVRTGSPPKEIVDYAKEIGAELIVLPAQGQNVLEAFNLGSTATRVMHAAHCPVLVLKG